MKSGAKFENPYFQVKIEVENFWVTNFVGSLNDFVYNKLAIYKDKEFTLFFVWLF